jgi:hypothetical protein
MRPAVLLLSLLVAGAVAEEPAKVPKFNSSRLTYDENGLAYLSIRTKARTAEGYEDNVRRVLFTGIAFTEGDNWRAEMTYKDSILDGEVVVVANNRLLSRFRYEKGRKILDEEGGGK